MNVNVPSVVLPSGSRMPLIGLGVYKAMPGEETYKAVLSALRLGYRHIDTARLYENEADVGRAVRDSGIPRKELFITSKLREVHWGYEKAIEGARSSNDLIGCDYIDLFLLHQPFDPKLRADTWRALEDLQTEGILRKNDILLQAFSPLARVKKIEDPRLVEIAKEVQATPAQVLIAWDLAKNFTTLPKSVHEARQKENLEAVNVKLTPEQVARLDALNEDYFSATDHVSNSAV
ncbi:unnamed protein product [Peronospora farinosa]|uniref:NADP-dependent oxidoreductase domain-containing protein n=1 Tax=Peronospora farinosa TaxID=134698 RepID=A0AAV0TBX6_9STRA|nr:unnamed protein product [Peronospora farinosa]CAI5719042.1 unnamed protein product [Peronospora farinosa]